MKKILLPALFEKNFESKVSRIMKLIIFLAFIFNIQVSAKSYSHDQFKSNMTGTNLDKIFKLQEESSSALDMANIAVKNKLLSIFPGRLLNDKLNYPLGENNLDVIPAMNKEADQRIIEGKITDENGIPLSGVSVLVKGTSQGTTTNTSGEFNLSVPDQAVLVISFIGYQAKEIVVGTNSNFNIQLKAVSSGLDEVVVIGYGTQKKVSLTSAVGTIKGEQLEKRTSSSIEQSLQGRIPGLTVIDNGGAPGYPYLDLVIRGINTLGDNEPLVIVDGIEQRLSDINPQDIETISVLKDASSTAIYGSRAGNGVVLITSKRAKAGKLSISYNGYYALQRTNNNPVHMGLENYMRLQNEAWINSSGNPIYTEDYIKEYVSATDRLKYPLPNTWFDAVLHTAPQTNHSLSISGGNENIKTLLSLRYLDQEGIIPNSDSKINEVRLNTDFKVSKKIRISTDINYKRVNTLTPICVSCVFNYMLQTSQWTVPKYPDGTYGISSDGKNPLLSAELAGTSKTANDYLTGSLKGEWDIFRGLKFSTQLAGRLITTSGKNYTNSYEIRDYYNPEIVTASQSLNSLNEIRNSVRELTINNLLNYSTTLGNHFLNFLAGYSQIENTGNNLSAFRQGFYNNDIQSIGQGANDATKSNSGNEYSWGLRSYFGRLNYTYQNKYLLEANARYDGSSRFTGSNRYGFFPSFSAGWRLSEEEFWSGLKNSVNEFKLRGSWGKSGNQAVNLYSYSTTLGISTYSFNGVPAAGYLQTQMSNKNLTWETTTQSDIGLDAQFLDNMISFSLDYYVKRNENILLTLPVPATLGLQASPQNAGRIDNKGLEFLLGFQKKFGMLGFNANLTFSMNNNKVIDLAGTGPYINGDSEIRYIIGEGFPYSGFWGYKTGGLFQTKEEISNYPTLESGTKAGDVKYLDLNGDGRISPDDMTYLGGSEFPKYTFSSDFNFSYKNFTLDFLFQGVAGAKRYIGGAIMQMGIWGGFTSDIFTNNYWTPENPNARFPRPLKFSVRNTQLSDRNIQNGDYLRLKNVKLKYQIPSSLTKKVGIEQVNVYVSGTNLLTFSKLNEWHVDPESRNRDAEYNYPQTSLTTFGLNIQF